VKLHPIKPGLKTPLTAHGKDDATDDPAQLAAWRAQWPDANWAVNCGASGLIVVDLDVRNGATEADLNALPPSFTVRSGGGGWHVYYSGVCPSKTQMQPGVDVKSEGGYVLVPPSYTADLTRTTRDGRVWGDGHYSVLYDRPIEPAPEWLIAATRASAPVERSTDATDCPPGLTRDDRWLHCARAHLKNLQAAVAGDGGTPLYIAAALMMRGWLLPRATADRLLRDEWCPRCVPPWTFEKAGDESNWEHTLDSAESSGPVEWGAKRPHTLLGVPAERPGDLVAHSAPAAAQPSQDLSGLQLAPGGWPWILRKGQWCWIHELDRQAYRGPIEKSDIKLQVRRTHGHVIALQGPKGADIPEDAFERMYQQRIDTLRSTYLARANTWDAASSTLELSALKWATFKPCFHEDVDEWLQALAGSRYSYLAQWLASCLALNRPAPALYIHGTANVGKSLLAHGISKIWTVAPAPFKEALDSFNEATGTCPLMYADEGFPEGMSFNDFREMVTSPTRRVNEKYKPKYAVEGFVRIILSTNNEQALRYQRTGTLTSADIHAIANRLLVINAGTAAEKTLQRFDAPEFARRKIAEHVLHLAATIELEPTYERMCAKPAGSAELLDALQGSRYTQVLRALAPAFAEKRQTAPGLQWQGPMALINVRELHAACRMVALGDFSETMREQDVRDFVNAFRAGAPVRVGMKWHHPIDAARVKLLVDAQD
jgi:hypothetical protein